MAKFVDPDKTDDKYKHTEKGGIRVLNLIRGEADAVYLKHDEANDKVKVWPLKGSTRNLQDRVLFGPVTLTRNDTGDWQLVEGEDFAKVFPEGTFEGVTAKIISDTDYLVEVKTNGKGDVRVFTRTGAGGLTDIGSDFSITVDVNTVSSTNDSITA